MISRVGGGFFLKDLESEVAVESLADDLLIIFFDIY
jgi:hypothetical protein